MSKGREGGWNGETGLGGDLGMMDMTEEGH